MMDLSSIFKVQVTLGVDDEKEVFDAKQIFRFRPNGTPEEVAELKAAGKNCAYIYVGHGGSYNCIYVRETVEEIAEKIEQAEDRIIERMKKHRLGIA